MTINKTNYLPAHIANYFLWRADQEKLDDMTPIKLIKLIYFAYGWTLAIFNRKLFNERIEAWRYGPVIPSIYHEFKKFGNLPIKQYAIDFVVETGKIDYPTIKQEDNDVLQVLGAIWKIYKDRNGWELSQITHEPNSPWNYSYAQGENTPMEDDKIIERAKEAILKYQDC